MWIYYIRLEYILKQGKSCKIKQKEIFLMNEIHHRKKRQEALINNDFVDIWLQFYILDASLILLFYMIKNL